MSPRPHRRARRGFTLAEMAVTLGVTGFAMALVLATFQSQQRSFEATEVTRAGQEAGRDAALELERTLRSAGYGVDPRHAFDFRHYRCLLPPCRDHAQKPDEIVFVTRNVSYRLTPFGATCTRAEGCVEGQAWHVPAVSLGDIEVKAKKGQVFRKGQILLVACPGASAVSMVTVAQTVPALSTDADVRLAIEPPLVGDPYRENNVGASCFTSGQAMAFRVDRYRYYIDHSNYDIPYLMLDTGVDMDLDGNLPETDLDDVLPVARGVEDLQIAYVLGRGPVAVAPDSNQNWVVGDEPGVIEEPNPLAPAPEYRTLTSDPVRYNLHPANVRAVRLNFGVRSPRPDPAPPNSWAGDGLLFRENRDNWIEYAPAAVLPNKHRLRRFSSTTTVSVRNLGSRATFIY